MTSVEANGQGKALSRAGLRGCFQCSKRRIVCDLAEPQCGKCLKKGIDCSGLGRIRFNDGVARRGKLKSCKVPVLGHPQVPLPSKTAFPAIRWSRQQHVLGPAGTATSGPRNKHETSRTPINSTGRRPAIEPPDSGTDAARSELLGPLDGVGEASSLQRDLVKDDARRKQYLHRWIPLLEPGVRMSFAYFAEAVAPVMVVLDRISNGYRDFILPLALEDEVLQRAVGVVAAQHLSQKRPDLKAAAEAGRAAVISRLRKDAMGSPQDKVFSLTTWATLVVLLVGETVTGNSEYGFLLRMLFCLANNTKNHAKSSALVSFLKQQTNMFKLLAQPVLTKPYGTSMATGTLEQHLDWLYYELPPGSEDELLVTTVKQAFVQAYHIYHQRSVTGDQAHEIETLKETIAQIDPDAYGAHALVWVCFVAAAESREWEHRSFFIARMMRVYMRTRFENIPAAIKMLQEIWDRHDGVHWTETLPQKSQVLVM